MCRRAVLIGLALVLGAVLPPTYGGTPPDPRAEFIRAHYTKYEYRIEARDGVKLFTAVYVPNAAHAAARRREQASRGGAGAAAVGSYPILLLRTPYSVGPYGADRYRARLGPAAAYEEEGFIFAFQDVRGRYLSEGDFVNMRPHREAKGPRDVDESTDTYDTIDWLIHNVPDNNGRVGQWGVSYPGFYTSAGMIDSHPALKAASPQAPISDWFWDDMHHHGAFILPLAFNFFASFGKPRPEPTTEHEERFDHKTFDGYQFFLDLGPLKNANPRYFKGEIAFWNEIVRHPNYDLFWQSRNILPHLKRIGAAVMTVGGWYDTEDLYGPLKTYRAIERQNPGAQNMLVMGPWRHGGWVRDSGDALGEIRFDFATAEWYRDVAELPFFLHHLKGGPEPELPEALMFETGANRWREFDMWPPLDVKPRQLYLREAGALSFEAPRERGDAHDAYASDPAKPVPYTMEITKDWARAYMTEDQRFAAWRPDVLVYDTEVLEQDLTLAGPIFADLWVSTTAHDADWVVKLIDVFPAELPEPEDGEAERDPTERERRMSGYQRLVRAEVFRGRFRESYEKPKRFTPLEPARVRFEMQDVLHTFKRGHRMMVQIQSSWFPFVDRNPQSWVENIFEANEADFVKATHRVYRSRDKASALELLVLPGEDGGGPID